MVNGRGHTITYAQNGLAAAPGGDLRALTGRFQITNQGVLRTTGGGALTAVTPRFVNEAGATVSVAGGAGLTLAPFTGSATTARLVNEGLIEVTGSGSRLLSQLPNVQGMSLDPHGDAAGHGEFHVDDNGVLELSRGAATKLRLSGALRFLADTGGKVDFQDEITFVTGDLRLITEAGGSIVLNGLEREFEDARVRIENAGVPFLESGITSLRVAGALCPGCPPPIPAIRPIDLVNTGTVHVQPGAGFASTFTSWGAHWRTDSRRV